MSASRAPRDQPGRRCTDAAGTGLIATIASVTIVLVFLMFSVQLLVGLYGRSVVTGIAYDGARYVAHRSDPGSPTVRAEAEARMRQQVGAMAMAFDWTGTGDDTVVLRVRAENPRLGIRGVSGSLATDHIDRTVSVRVERPR